MQPTNLHMANLITLTSQCTWVCCWGEKSSRLPWFMCWPYVFIKVVGLLTTSTIGVCVCWNDHYHGLTKERPWVEHLTSLPKMGVGTLLWDYGTSKSTLAIAVSVVQMEWSRSMRPWWPQRYLRFPSLVCYSCSSQPGGLRLSLVTSELTFFFIWEWGWAPSVQLTRAHWC